MAAGVLPKPGTKRGPCKTDCAHRDCAQTKADAMSVCRFCHKTIGYGNGFFRSHAGALAHAMCVDLAIEQNPNDPRLDVL